MRLNLASKISIALVGVLALAVLSSIVAIGSAYRFEDIQRTLVADNLESVRAAEELEIALLEQRGYVSSYMLDDGNKTWLEQLDLHRKDFDVWLVSAREAARSNEEREILDQLEEVQQAYAAKRDEAVTLYDLGQGEQARQVLLRDVSKLYQQSYDLCEAFIAVNQKLVAAAAANVRRQVEQITVVVTAMLLVTVGLGVALMWLFFQGVVVPVRRIAAEARSAAGDEVGDGQDPRADELRELGRYVQLLMTNVAETRSDLERSRVQLAHADKLAVVGKLAASVAHEIRNPLTSVKMWLYSLRRGVGQDGETQKKFDIVSSEIARLESIVRSFLEFARPPKLNVQLHPVGLLIEKTLELLHHRLEDEHIEVELVEEPDLPQVLADPEQLKQVLLNLINNAVEAMPEGGRIGISTSRSRHGGREMVAIQVMDSGTGIPEDVQRRLFEPFYTTKEEGNGLGLCIAASVMARHHGLLELDSSGPQGTRWTIWIPVAAKELRI